MKTNFKITQKLMLGLTLLIGLNSCDTKEKVDEKAEREKALAEKNKAIENLAVQFVEKTAIPTYTQLANSAEKLSDKLIELKNNPTQESINAACALYKQTRAWWEMSEAFLFGPADYFGIDPFIDTWPLDEKAYSEVMASDKMEAMIKSDKFDADLVSEYLNAEGEQASVLGFHAIEYTLFADGQPKQLSSITDKEKKLAYAAVVGMELRRRCYQLEIGWGGEGLSAARTKVLKDAGLTYLNENTSKAYGISLKTADNVLFKSWEAVVQTIIDGSIDIVNEVGTTKIQTAYDHAKDNDANYIESPYSWNSRQDFMDNIKGVKNVYMGGLTETGVQTRDESKSLHSYIAKNNPALDQKIVAAIDNAIAKINAIPHPFKNHATDAKVKEAIDACAELTGALEESKKIFSSDFE